MRGRGRSPHPRGSRSRAPDETDKIPLVPEPDLRSEDPLPDDPPSGPPAARGAKRILLLALGWLFVGLGALGVPLPGLPTTPFLILAAACFARSSPRFHQALLRNRILGPYLRQWQKDHSIPGNAKRRAYVVIAITFTVSIYFVPLTWVRVLLAVIGVSLCLFLHKLRTTRPEDAVDPALAEQAD